MLSLIQRTLLPKEAPVLRPQERKSGVELTVEQCASLCEVAQRLRRLGYRTVSSEGLVILHPDEQIVWNGYMYQAVSFRHGHYLERTLSLEEACEKLEAWLDGRQYLGGAIGPEGLRILRVLWDRDR